MGNTIRIGKGVGYKRDDGKLCMMRCFKCGLENWALMVHNGTCAWCGHDANAKQEAKRDSEINRIYKFIMSNRGEFKTPSGWIEATGAKITSETLARKLRERSKSNTEIKKKYYRNAENEDIAIYGAE